MSHQLDSWVVVPVVAVEVTDTAVLVLAADEVEDLVDEVVVAISP